MEVPEKIEVYYSFSPLLGKSHFDLVAEKARAVGIEFPNLIIKCREHWNDHRNTIQIMGFIEEEESEIFLSKMQELQNLMEIKS